MDLEFSLAQKRREKEKKQRIEEAVKKREAEEKRKRAALAERERIDQITEQRKQREAEQREVEEELRLREEERTGGIKYCVVLKAVPTSQDGERITLPPSALETLEAQSAIDPSRPLTFEVCAIDEQGSVLSTTHVGVAEFTAQENTVGVPPKTALSLTKERGGGLSTLRVKYVKLPMPPKSFVRFQPRGEGFHQQGADVVSLDLKAVLERELSRHTAISKGDWLPIRHEKMTYELVVVNLEPSDALSLVNTDLEVDLLPSERAQYEQEKKARAKEEAAAAVLAKVQEAALRAERAEHIRSSLPIEPPSNTPHSVLLLVRLPQGGQCSRRFLHTDYISFVLAWIGCQPVVVESGLDESNVTLNMNYPKRSFTSTDAGLTLTEAGLTGKREALFLQGESVKDEAGQGGVVGEAEDSMEVDEFVELSEEWASAAAVQKEKLDRQLSDEGKMALQEASETDVEVAKPSTDKVAVFHMLVAYGFDKTRAAAVAQRFGDSVSELYNMGFTNHKLNVDLLERYGGRMLRVVNVLSERPQEEESQMAPSIPALSQTPSQVLQPQSQVQPQVQVSFQTKFAELVSSGMAPNEAAAEALQVLAQGTVEAVKWGAELEELRGMGFCDEGRNLELLERYQGRLVRVVNTLAGAD